MISSFKLKTVFQTLLALAIVIPSASLFAFVAPWEKEPDFFQDERGNIYYHSEVEEKEKFNKLEQEYQERFEQIRQNGGDPEAYRQLNREFDDRFDRAGQGKD